MIFGSVPDGLTIILDPLLSSKEITFEIGRSGPLVTVFSSVFVTLFFNKSVIFKTFSPPILDGGEFLNVETISEISSMPLFPLIVFVSSYLDVLHILYKFDSVYQLG